MFCTHEQSSVEVQYEYACNEPSCSGQCVRDGVSACGSVCTCSDGRNLTASNACPVRKFFPGFSKTITAFGLFFWFFPLYLEKTVVVCTSLGQKPDTCEMCYFSTEMDLLRPYIRLITLNKIKLICQHLPT